MENKIEKRTLKNGMKVYFYQTPNKHSAEVRLITKAGGKDKHFLMNGKEYHYADGMAHFLEHLLIEHSQYGDLMTVLGEHQMNCNGVTSPNCTTYYFTTARYLEFGIETLLRGINQPIFTEEDVEKTKSAIYEEIRKGRDNKYRLLNERANKNLYHTRDYINNLGSLKDIEDITYEQVKTYYEAFYQPNNQLLVIGGNFDLEKIITLIEKITGEINVISHNVNSIQYNEPNEVVVPNDVIKMPTGESIVNLVYKINISGLNDKEKNKLSYYLRYFCRMNFSKTSKVYQKLIKDGIIYSNIGSSCELNEGFIELLIEGNTNQKDAFLKAVKEVIQNPEFDEELFYLYQCQEKMDICCFSESYHNVIMNLINNIIQMHYESTDTIEDVNELSFEEFQAYIKNLDFNHSITLILEDEEEK